MVFLSFARRRRFCNFCLGQNTPCICSAQSACWSEVLSRLILRACGGIIAAKERECYGSSLSVLSIGEGRCDGKVEMSEAVIVAVKWI